MKAFRWAGNASWVVAWVLGSGIAFAQPGALAPPPSAVRKQKALEFLDRSGGRWVTDHSCVSCHSGWSYGFARIGTPGWETSAARELEAYIVRRQSDWDHIDPWYGSRGSSKGTESFGSEGVLGAATLVELDLARGLQQASAATQLAIRHMLALVQPDGSLPWLDYRLQPLESTQARIFGSALAQVALSRSKLSTRPEFASSSSKLSAYLKSAFTASSTPLYYKIAIGWAASATPGLLTSAQIQGLVQSTTSIQRPDGGWSMNALGAWSKQGSFPWSGAQQSDDNATSYLLMVLTRIQAGSGTAVAIPGLAGAVQGARAWMLAHQEADGSWPGNSVNMDSSENHEYMQDLATAFAVKSLGDF